MKHITYIGPCDVLPAGEDDNGDIKELILHDPESGEVVHYRMTQELAGQVARKLKASNQSLADDIGRAQARAKLEIPGQNGSGPMTAPDALRRAGG